MTHLVLLALRNVINIERTASAVFFFNLKFAD